MRSGLAAVLVVCGSLLPGTTRAKGLDDGLDALKDAIEEVSDEGGRCKKKLLSDLRELKDDYEEAVDHPSSKNLQRARRAIEDLEDKTDVCPRKVGRLLREARDALKDDDREDRKDREDRRERRHERRSEKKSDAKARNAKVPYADWTADCIDLWLMYRIASTTMNDSKALKMIDDLSIAPCKTQQQLSESRWPNGVIAKWANGEWHYPGGTVAKYAGGEFHYPSGGVAKYAGGEWHYPNGVLAKTAGGEWYYPNGTIAGDWKALQGWACSKRGQKECDALNKEYDSDVEDWRNYALIDLAYRAR